MLGFTVGPISQDLGHHPMWDGSHPGRVRLRFCHMCLFLFFTRCPGRPCCPSGENKSEVSSVHRVGREDRGGEMQGIPLSGSKNLAWLRGRPLVCFSRRARCQGTGARATRELEELEVEPRETSPCLTSSSSCLSGRPVPLQHLLYQHMLACGLEMLHGCSRDCGL